MATTTTGTTADTATEVALDGNIGNLFSHYYEVRELDPALAESVFKKVVNSFATYIGQNNITAKANSNGFQVKDSKAGITVNVMPSRQYSLTVTPTTTVADVKSLEQIDLSSGTTVTLRLKYEDYNDSPEGISSIVEKIKMSLLANAKITQLNNETSFAVKITKSTSRFEVGILVKGMRLASIEGAIKYGVKEGVAFLDGTTRKTVFPTVRLVVDTMTGPKNIQLLRFLVAFLDNSLPANQAFELLNNATENRELVTLLVKIGAKVDLKDISKLKKMFDGKKVIDIRLPFRMNASDLVAVNGRIGDAPTVVTPYEGTLDPALAPLLATSNSEEVALNALKNYSSNVHNGTKLVAGFTYLSTVSPAELKKAMSDIHNQTGLTIAGQTSNLFNFSTNEVALGGKVQPQTMGTTMNAESMAKMMQMMQASGMI